MDIKINNIIEKYSGEERIKLQKHFVNLYGTDEIAKEKANSFAVGFAKACEMILSELKK